MKKQFYFDDRVQHGMTYEEYKKMINRIISDSAGDTSESDESSRIEFTKLNLHRSARIEKTYSVSDELKFLLQNIIKPQLWMVITEEWCGDSAQNLPYIVKMSEINNLINLKIILRDDNPDIMDHYLTNGVLRSIPKLVAFDSEGNELFEWGSRPKEAEMLVSQLKSKGMPKTEWNKKLHLWYAKNKGRSIENEFIEILSNLSVNSPEYFAKQVSLK